MKTILIIDDNTQIRENIAEILEFSGYVTLTAENGKKGVETAVREKPALIICDIMMPELDGYGVLHLLKRNPTTEHIPFIFLTAKTERVDLRKGMEMGADDFITKPFDDLELLNAVEVRIKKQDILQNKYAAGQTGANDLMKDLSGSGLITMDLSQYETDQVPKKQFLYTLNKRPKHLFYLKSGKVKVSKNNDDGKDYITQICTTGDFIGYIALMENKMYDDSAEVLEESEVVLIPKEEFLAAVFGDMAIASKFIKLIAENVKQQEERLMNLAYSSLRKRIAKALVVIHSKFNGNKDSTHIIDISRDDIARYVGTATESLIRTLSDFKTEKLIEIKDGKIRILNSDKLNSLPY
jgi:CheY-like chemotaxis protein/CRP-like cAMP-binding protein